MSKKFVDLNEDLTKSVERVINEEKKIAEESEFDDVAAINNLAGQVGMAPFEVVGEVEPEGEMPADETVDEVPPEEEYVDEGETDTTVTFTAPALKALIAHVPEEVAEGDMDEFCEMCVAQFGVEADGEPVTVTEEDVLQFIAEEEAEEGEEVLDVDAEGEAADEEAPGGEVTGPPEGEFDAAGDAGEVGGAGTNC